jgi:phage terminase large subunit-like protein
MRLRYAPFYAAILVLLTACATLGVSSPQTFNEKLAAGYSTVTASRDTTATLLTSGKLTAADAQNVQQQLDNARTGLDLARQVHATDPAAGDAKIDAVVTALTALQAYLSTKGGTP